MKRRTWFIQMISGLIPIASLGTLFSANVYAHRGREHEHESDKGKDMMHSTVPFRPCTLEELERFHGHVGPYVTLGARMGEHAHLTYNMPRYFGVMVEVECPQSPPHSCLIDGLMVSTGATFGKKNIHHTHAKEIRVIIQNEETGDTAIYKLKESLKAKLQQWIDEDTPIPERGKWCFKQKAEDLFDIEFQVG